MKLAQTITLIAATVTAGITAGTMAAFAYSVIPGLQRNGDDRTFVDTMNQMNKAILNGWFMLCFMGALLFIIAAGLLQLHRHERPVLYWLIAAFVLYSAALLITSGVNVPLNNQMLHDADHHVASFAVIRDHFEAKWVQWNVIRTVVHAAAVVALAGALVAHGRVHSGVSTASQDATPSYQAPTPAAYR